MSGIGGIFNFYEGPVDRDSLMYLWESLADRGPDGGDVTIQGSAGLCYRAFHTNGESRLEKQPLVHPDGRTLVGDLRIDNRDELITQLRDLLKCERAKITDIEIAMAAHQQWGDLFAQQIVGEYALILWDPQNRKVLLSRDHIGARTLYYHLNQERLICSSEIEPLLSVAGIPLQVNDEYIAGYLAQNPEPWLTPYKNIHALPPAHVCIIQDGDLRQQRFWGLDSVKEIRYRNDSEYEDHFNHLFREAVRGPLRTDQPVFAELSGGLDSSSIVCVADQIIANGETDARTLETVSQVFDDSPSSDERKFIRYVEEQRGRRGHHLPEEKYRLLSPTISESNDLNLNPCLVSFEYHRALCESMRASGSRVLLSGQGGDEMLNSGYDPSSELADLFIEFHPLRLHRRLKIWSHTLKKPYLHLLWKNSIVPTLPPRIQFKLEHNPVLEKSHLFIPHFATRTNLYERMAGAIDVFRCHLPSRRLQSRGFVSVVQSIAAGYRRDIGDIDVSYPFLHRPLVEFLQAIPFEQRVRPGETRSLIRRSLRNVLPEKILRRKSKGNPTEAFFRAVTREHTWVSKIFEEPRVSSCGYVDAGRLRTELNKAQFGCEINSMLFLKIIPLEIWLRGLERRSSPVKGRTRTERPISPELMVHFMNAEGSLS